MPDQKIDNLLNLAMDATPQERRKSGNLNVESKFLYRRTDMDNSTKKLLEECSVGCKMGIESMEQVQHHVTDAKIAATIEKSCSKHKELEDCMNISFSVSGVVPVLRVSCSPSTGVSIFFFAVIYINPLFLFPVYAYLRQVAFYCACNC